MELKYPIFNWKGFLCFKEIEIDLPCSKIRFFYFCMVSGNPCALTTFDFLI
jgi:hypothetical protein